MGETGKRVDPLANRRFYIEIANVAEAEFSEASGLEAEVEVFEYQEGGCNSYTHRLPGRVKFPNVVLKRGMTESLDLWKWFEDVTQAKIQRMDVGIVLYDETTKMAKRRWTLERAYPVKWVGPSFKASDNAIAIETLELAHEGLRRA